MPWPWSKRVLTRKELGALGERHAARFLRAKGMRLLEANFLGRHGELDLIAREGEILVFVEVRTRTTDWMTPMESVNRKKQDKIVRTARSYLRVRRLPECCIRYDVVEVIATPSGQVTEVRHIEDAFIEGM